MGRGEKWEMREGREKGERSEKEKR